MTGGQMYTASVLADSVSPEGHRITTVRVVYPHAVHKDMLRHRCMNRNVESFRAQPPEALIANLRAGHAFKPDVFAKRTKGMGQSAVAVAEQDKASLMWDAHVENACRLAEAFIEMDLAKQQVNFVLQDLCPLTEVITATDWSNFYALRTEVKDDGTPVARPEVYLTAVAIRDAIEASTPTLLEHGQIHLPMVTDSELAMLCVEHTPNVEAFWIGVSAGRCARISYGDFEWWTEDAAGVSFPRSRKLLAAGHMSPFEQQARCFSPARWDLVRDMKSSILLAYGIPPRQRSEMVRQAEYSGNLRGWVPARKDFAGEWDYSVLREGL